MTTPATRDEPWDDDRLESALAARATGTNATGDLIETTVTRLRAMPAHERGWQRLVPAAVVILAIGLGALGFRITSRVDEGAPPASPLSKGTIQPTSNDPERPWPPASVLDVPMPTADSERAPRFGLVDRSGLIVEARPAGENDPRGPLEGMQPGEMSIAQIVPDTVIAYWDGAVCDDRFVLTAYGDRAGEPPDHLVLRGEIADRCRLALVRRGIVLRFSQAVDATAMEGWDRVGTPFEAFPPSGSVVVFLRKDGGFDLPRVRAAFVDLSGRVASVRAPRDDERRALNPNGDAGPALLPDPTVRRRYQLVWTGGICDGDTVVTVDASFAGVLVERRSDGPCDSMGVERRLILDVDGPLDPPAVEVRYAETSTGAP